MASNFTKFDDTGTASSISPALRAAAGVQGAASANPTDITRKQSSKQSAKLDAARAKEATKPGVFMASFNLSNAIIGAGVGGMPFALKEAGFFAGIVLLIVVAASSDYSIRLLIKLGKTVNKKHYEHLVSSQFGQVGYIAVSAAMGIFAYGAMCAYLIGISDTMSIVVSTYFGVDMVAQPWMKRVVLVVVAVGAVLPLAALKDMAKLSKTSFVSLLSVLFVTFVVVLRAITGPGDAPVPVAEADLALEVIDVNFFPAIGIVAFAFVCHHACFIIYNTLRDNTEARWNKTVHVSVGVALFFLLTLAMAAYLTFRGIMHSNFLTNYSSTDSLVNFVRVLFALTQTLTYPLEFFVARHAVHALFFASDKGFTDQKHYAITLLLWSSSLAIALNVTDLGVVLELTGGVSAVFIGFVMPAMLHFKMSEHAWRLWRNPPGKRWAAAKELLPSMWLIVFGVLAMIFTLITIGSSFVAGGSSTPRDAFAVDAANVTAPAGGGGGTPTGNDGSADDPGWDPAFQPTASARRTLLSRLF